MIVEPSKLKVKVKLNYYTTTITITSICPSNSTFDILFVSHSTCEKIFIFGFEDVIKRNETRDFII